MRKVKNRTIFTRDNLEVLRGMQPNSIDLIYLDPPFNSKHNYAAPIGSKAAGAEFKDTWTLRDIDKAWIGQLADEHPKLHAIIEAVGTVNGDSSRSYLLYMAVRLIEMHRVLKDTGSLYLHCDTTMSHSVKLLLDSIFGNKYFRNEIVWQRGTPSGGKAGGQKFVPNHDIIFSYSKTDNFNYTRQYSPYGQEYISQRFTHCDENGRRYRKQIRGRKQYLDESKGKPIQDIWTDLYPVNPNSKERTGYPTQKPVVLLKRIIAASSNEGDMVLDPFCGCATTCVAAEMLGRQWIGIDVSPKALELVRTRMRNEVYVGDEGDMFNPGSIVERTDIPILSAKRSKNIKQTLYGEQHGICNGCKTHFPFRNFHVDHIVPTSKGGPDDDSNMQLLCGWCNSVKGDRAMAYLMTKLGKRE